MKRVSELTAIPGILCLVVLMLYDEQIRSFSGLLYIVMITILGVGFISTHIQSSRDREAATAANAVAKFKRENNITD